jgi:hypothetical protein
MCQSVVELGFYSGRSLEMGRAEVPALSRAVPQDGNELNGMGNLKRQNKPMQKSTSLVIGEKIRYARLKFVPYLEKL